MQCVLTIIGLSELCATSRGHQFWYFFFCFLLSQLFSQNLEGVILGLCMCFQFTKILGLQTKQRRAEKICYLIPFQHISKLNLFPESKGSQFFSGWVCKFVGQAFNKMHFLPPCDKSTIYNEKQVISIILTTVGRHFSRNLHIFISYLQSTNFTAQKCNLQSTCFDPL